MLVFYEQYLRSPRVTSASGTSQVTIIRPEKAVASEPRAKAGFICVFKVTQPRKVYSVYSQHSAL